MSVATLITGLPTRREPVSGPSRRLVSWCTPQRTWGLVFAILALFASPASVFGGLYNPCEPDEGPFDIEWMDPNNHNFGFRDVLLKYRSLLGAEFDNPALLRYKLMQQNLLKNPNLNSLTSMEQLSASEYLIRRGDAARAQGLLLGLSRTAPDNFLVSCNLAVAYEQTQNYVNAIASMKDALSKWPATLDKLSPDQVKLFKSILPNRPLPLETVDDTFNRLREGEEYFLKLLQWRAAEQFKRKAKKLPALDAEVDGIFFAGRKGPDEAIRYVGDKGDFQPGKLAAAEKAKLPGGSIDGAIRIVQQLLVWLPHDRGLFRQLGELYSTRGGENDILAARAIFKELVEPPTGGTGFRVSRDPDLRQRREVLDNFKFPEPPPPPPVPPDIGVVINTDRTPETPFSWRTVAVIFGFGIIVGIVGQWQINEIRRRRQRSGQAPPNDAAPPDSITAHPTHPRPH